MLDARELTVELDVEAGADGAVVRALDALTLSIERGETFALVGESGCGKSMTALALMRLLPDNGLVTGGDVHLRARVGEGGDVDVLALPEAAMRRVRGGRIGMIFQEPGTSLNPVMTVGRQVVEAIEAHTPLRGAAARARALEWLGRVGIPEPERRFDDYPFRMSGGQKQRVMIALALAAEPDFLVADEPTTALDVTIQAQILALLRQLQAERGMGLLLITHDLAVVSGMAHRVALMYAGQIVEVAPAAEFFAAPRHPYAQALMRALPSAQGRGQPLAAIAGTVPPLTQRFAGCRFAPRCGAARADCGQRAPRLEPLQAGHAVRCWLASESPALRTASTAPAPVAAAEPAQVSAGQASEPPLLLQVQDLSVRFALQRPWLARGPREFAAVAGVSFELRAGRTLALVGESGCGKTTTGKALVQLLRGTARTEGRAWLHPAGGGQPQDLFALQGEALRAARRQVQIVFQDPFASLDPRMGVAEILDEGLAALRPELDVAERRQRLERLVEQVGLRRDALDRSPHEFSGGQRQRIAIARALAVEPRLIVCDEPTSALDVSVQAQILNLLRELQRELGVSFLFITHNIGVVEVMADEVVVMQHGMVVETGRTEQLLREPHQAYTKALLAAVPRVPTT
ncbi:MAG: ABC transporter ATP-binding protein [Betaproteobacteria bacterium]